MKLTNSKLAGALRCLVIFVTIIPCFAQGPLDPTGPPGETGRSLEEIWNKVDGLELTVDEVDDAVGNIGQKVDQQQTDTQTLDTKLNSLQTTINQQQTIIDQLAQQNAALLQVISDLGADNNLYRWDSEQVVDADSLYAKPLLGFNDKDEPSIVYYKNPPGGTEGLAIADLVNGTWQVTMIDQNYQGTTVADHSVAFTDSGFPVVAYGLNGDLYVESRYTLFNTYLWTLDEVDTGGGDASQANSIAIDSQGDLAVAFYKIDGNGEGLYYAHRPSPTATWDVEEVVTGYEVRDITLKFTADDTPVIVFVNNDDEEFRIAAYNSGEGEWNIDRFGTGTKIAFSLGMTINPDGEAFTVRAGTQSSNTTGTGSFEVIYGVRYGIRPDGFPASFTAPLLDRERSINIESEVSVAMAPSGVVGTAYHFVESATLGRSVLHYAEYRDGGWLTSRVFDSQATSVSLAYAPDGQPAIAFLNGEEVYYTKREPLSVAP